MRRPSTIAIAHLLRQTAAASHKNEPCHMPSRWLSRAITRSLRTAMRSTGTGADASTLSSAGRHRIVTANC